MKLLQYLFHGKGGKMGSPPPNQQSEIENILPGLLELAKVSFDTVLDADKHEDEKAYRILTAIAFLTAAAAVIFAAIYQLQSSSGNKVTFNEINYAIIAFSCYIFFILIGSALYLLALGPNLNMPAKKQSKVTSLLFFERISTYRENWYNEWNIDFTKKEDVLIFKGIKDKRNAVKDTEFLEMLREKMYWNYIVEAKLIAEKASAKVSLMRCGNISFLIAFMSLLGLIVILFPIQPLIQLLILMMEITFLLSVVASGYSKLPGIHPFIKIIFWTLVIISLIAVAIVIQIPIIQTIAIVLAIIIFFTLLLAKHIVALFKVGD